MKIYKFLFFLISPFMLFSQTETIRGFVYEDSSSEPIIFANVYPFRRFGSPALLAVLHLPIALWLVVGMAYVGGRWRNSSRRMDFVRFSGELFVYYTLFACGGGVLIALTLIMFSGIGVNADWLVAEWLLPCGALGAVIVGAGVVDIQQKMLQQ